jgi:hypothetical protein
MLINSDKRLRRHDVADRLLGHAEEKRAMNGRCDDYRHFVALDIHKGLCQYDAPPGISLAEIAPSIPCTPGSHQSALSAFHSIVANPRSAANRRRVESH